MDIAKRHELCNAGTLVGKQKLHVEHFDVFWRSRYAWDKRGAHYKLALVDNTSLCCYCVDGGYLPLLISETGRAYYMSDEPLPLDYAMGVCEDYARGINAGRQALKDAAWRNAPATEKQLAALNRVSIPAWQGITKGEAYDIMNRAFSRESASEKQIWYIKKHGLHSKPELLTEYEACKLIQQDKERQAV